MKTSLNKLLLRTAAALGICLSLTTFMEPLLSAQESVRQVMASGTVTDDQGEPLPGVGVLVKNSQAGTVSDADGYFSLNVPVGATLQFMCVGFKTLEAVASASMNIVLQEDTDMLEDVVVIGYGTVKKSDLTSSIATVSGTTISKSASTSIRDILQGKVAGMDIQADRYEGENRSFYIRGTRSLRASNTPLTIVDGVPAALSEVNVHDIASN